MASPLLDLAVRRQVLLERLKAGQIRSFEAAFRDMERAVRGAFADLDGNLTEEGRRFFRSFLGGLEKDLARPLTEQTNLYVAELEKTAGLYAAAEATDLASVIAGVGGSLKIPTAAQAFKRALEIPMSHSGEPLKDFIGSFSERESGRLLNRIRQGVAQGRTNQELVRSVIGTKARGYRDGVLSLSRRNAQAMIRTATQHVASSARQNLWENNRDVVEKYQWVSTLDRRTTSVCKSLDGREFELGKGPTPPIHINCRSTTIAVVSDEFDFLKKGRTRSAEFGPVDGDKDYYDWLKRQSESVQIEALGPTRAKLFRDGGLSADEFAALQLDKNFQPLTLAEMEAIDPESFKRAGLGG